MKPEMPKVRNDLEFIPIQQGNQTVVMVRDHLGLVSEGTALPSDLFELMTLLDGSHSFRDLQMFMMRKKGGLLVGQEEIQSILSHLDEYYLLESERFQEARRKIVAEFTASPIRPCSHCGQSYPAKRQELEQKLDEILSLSNVNTQSALGAINAVLAPHIDLSVGQKGYARAYKWLGPLEASRVILLGVGHQMREGIFCLTSKDFQTPLGLVRTDKEAVEKLLGVGSQAIAPNDFPHRSEHSLEFQLLFLKHLSKDRDFSIVPILCGSLWSEPSSCYRDIFIKRTGSFLKQLRNILEDKQTPTIVVAGVDMSHIGPKFGHDAPAAYLKTQAQEHDRALLEAVLELDAKVFWQEATRVQDKYNVCGFTVLACLLEILPPSKGTLLHYEMWFEAPTQSAVSFCAVGFARS